MTTADLDALAALFAKMTPGPYTAESESDANGRFYAYAQTPKLGLTFLFESSFERLADTEQQANIEGIVALVNAAPDLIALARKGLEAEGRTCDKCRHRYWPRPGVDFCKYHHNRCDDLGNTCGVFEVKEPA